ncbi:MAG: hypothetical protein LBD85_00120 [Oscillospiraceae bacterium]|jgi:hypothetical protein|nr:hypothetical protein [Oscillospiraceae bacterium]
MRELKQTRIAKEVTLGGNEYYIRPFPAFTAANLSGEIGAVIAPLLGGLLPLLNDGVDLMSIDVGSFSGALSGLSGNKLESVLSKLLVKHGNIAVKLEGETDAVTLDNDLVNEVFCGSAQDMFILAFEVIKVNYAGFFEKLGSLSGVRGKGEIAATADRNSTDI